MRLPYLGLAALLSITIVAISFTRIAYQLRYEPQAVLALAPLPTRPADGINLHDGRTITQTFTLTVDVISHVGIGVTNVHAVADGVLTVVISDQNNRVLYTGHTPVAALRADSFTYLPAPARLTPNTRYTLRLSTAGVPVANSLRVWYETADDKFPAGQLAVNAQARPGNIAFSLEQRPTPFVVWTKFISTPAVLILAVISLPLLVGASAWLKRPLTVPLQPMPWRELLFAGTLAAVVAISVTLPYYTNLDRITTSGDVQRSLVYRALARDALLHHGQLGLWDPYLCGGEPLLANMESANLGPWFLLVLVFGENLGTRLSVTATLILGFLGAYVLARTAVHANRLGGLVAGMLFSFSGFQMLAFANGNFAWLPVGLMPWLVWTYIQSLRDTKYVALAALIGAGIFFGGSIHMLVYSLLIIAILGLVLALRYRSWRPLILLLIVGSLLIPLTAIKLLPVAGIQAVSGPFDRPPPFIQPWSWFNKMFLDRQQLATTGWRFAATGENFRWIEYGSYIGLLPFLLCIRAIPRLVRQPLGLACIVGSVVLLLMTFGAWPWTWLHQVPMLDSILRNPQRARVALLLLGGISAGYGLTIVTRRRLLQAILTLIVIVDLATFHSALYNNLFRFPRPTITSSPDFYRVTESYSDESATGIYKVSYENYRANQGTTDMCMPYMMGKGVHAVGRDSSNPAQPYRGEAYLTNGQAARLTDLTANKISVALRTSDPTWLVLNQNFFPGWRTEPPHEVINYNGLVAARVTPADRTVVFVYAPRAYHAGALISILTCLLAGILWRSTPYRGSATAQVGVPPQTS